MKRRAAPKREAAGVSSLFPYLDGLVCTMGALIVVLVVMARQPPAKVAETAHAPADDELAIKRSDLEWRISQLRESREATKKLLAEKQTELGHIEEHSRRLRGQLDELTAARERLSQMAAGDEHDQAKLKSELDRLHYRVAGLRNELGKVMEKARENQQSYAVIPYHGANETYRRPIYIECRSTGVILQPSGLTLTEQDFAIDAGLAGPLASAVRAAREYYLRNALKGEGETGSAYPLMIVRPDGVSAYFAARSVLESLGPDFGYELVAQDWSIEYPSADPMLVLAMKQAVNEGRMRQTRLASAAPGLFYNSRQVSFRAAPRAGLTAGGSSGAGGSLHRSRSVFASGRPLGVQGGANAAGRAGGNGASRSGVQDNPYLDALAEEDARGNDQGLARQGPGGAWPGKQGGSHLRGNGGIGGIGIGDGNAGEPLVSSGQGSGIGGQGTGTGREGSGFGQQGSGYRVQGSGSSLSGGIADQQGAFGSGNGKQQFAGGGRAGTRHARGAGAGTELASTAGGATIRGKGATGGFAAAGDLAGGGSTGTGKAAMAGTAGAAGADTGSATRTGAGPAQTTGAGPATTSGAGPATRAGAIGRAPTGAGVGDSPDTAGSALATDDGTSAGDASGGASSASDGARSSGKRSPGVGQVASSGTGGTGARGSSGARASRGGSSGSSSSVSGSPSGGMSGSSSASAGGGSPGGGSMGSSMMQPGQMGMPMPMISMGAQPSANQASSSSRGGKRERNWANPDASTTNVPVERRIQIICDAEHLTVMPEGRALRGMKVIKLGPHTEDSLDELASSVWDRIDSWGTAGRGMYWRPKLQMIIEPGGQQRYTELQALMADSGFDVHGRPRMVKPKRK